MIPAVKTGRFASVRELDEFPGWAAIPGSLPDAGIPAGICRRCSVVVLPASSRPALLL